MRKGLANLRGMGELSQAEFARAVRGDHVIPGAPLPVEPIVMGISSVARAAVRRVHKESAAAAQAYYAGKVAKYLYQGGGAAATARSYGDSVDRYITWDGTEAPAELDESNTIVFAPGDAVRAIAHVVLEDEDGRREARLLLWDELALDESAAQMLALPVVECVNHAFGPDSALAVDVWQLARAERFTVLPDEAEARRSDVEALLAQF